MGLTIGPLHVRRSTFIDAEPARVWAEFVSEASLKGWLDRGHSLLSADLRPGGTLRFTVTIDGARHGFGGKVVVMEPERELSLESQWEGPEAWPVPTFWTFRLTPLYEGTLVELFHHGFERLGAAAADNLEGYEAGWDCKHLEALRKLIET